MLCSISKYLPAEDGVPPPGPPQRLKAQTTKPPSLLVPPLPTVLPPHLANNKYVMECHERKKVEHQAIMDEAAERARLASGMPKVGLCGSVHLCMLHNDFFFANCSLHILRGRALPRP